MAASSQDLLPGPSGLLNLLFFCIFLNININNVNINFIYIYIWIEHPLLCLRAGTPCSMVQTLPAPSSYKIHAVVLPTPGFESRGPPTHVLDADSMLLSFTDPQVNHLWNANHGKIVGGRARRFITNIPDFKGKKIPEILAKESQHFLALDYLASFSPSGSLFLQNSPLGGTRALRSCSLTSDRRRASLDARAHPRRAAPPGPAPTAPAQPRSRPLRRCPRKRFLPTQPPQPLGSQALCLSRLVGPLLHGPVCQDCSGGRPVRQAGPRSDLWILESVTGE